MFPLCTTPRHLVTVVMVIVLALQACVLPVSAQSDSAGAASPDANYSLSGRVVTPADEPVPGVTVTATLIDTKDSIIFLPGVMGTELRNDPRDQAGCEDRAAGKLWVDLNSLHNLISLYLNDNGDGPLNYCDQISPNGRVVWPMIAPPLITPPYEKFIDAVDNEFNVLVYDGYDWRLSLTDAVEKLDTFINDNADGKVFLVAHSMGGLLARAYVANAARANKVAGVVTVGTPYLGAPLMAQRMVSGATGTPVDWLLNPFQLKGIARSSPGIQQLLPSAAYMASLQPKDYYLPATGGTLDSYQKTADYFVAQDYLRSNTLDIAEAFHAELDGFDKNFHAQGRYTVLYSTDTATPTRLREKSCQFGAKLCVDVIARRFGDGTVPQASASLRWLSAGARAGVTFCNFSANWQKFKEHGDLFLDDRVIADVLHVLNGEPVEHCDVDTTMQAAANAGSLREYTVWGEGRVQVVDAQGNFTGVDVNGILIRNLADVTYLLTDGGVILTMPADATYQVATYQTGSQPMQMVVSDLGVNPTAAAAGDAELVAQAQAVFDNVPAAAGGVAIVETAAAPLTQLVLKVDTTADGTPEVTLNPGAVITEPVDLQDMTMPTTLLSVTGSQNGAGEYMGAVTVSLTAQDNGSGVLKSYTSLDAGQTWQEYTSPIQIAAGQAQAVQAYSVDKAGNQEYPPVEQTLRFTGQTHLYLPHVQNGAPQTVARVDVETEQSQEAQLLAEVAPSVALQPADASVIQPAAAAVYTATTGADGRYTFASVPAGTYEVAVQFAGWTITPAKQTVTLTGNVDNISFSAAPSVIDTAEMVFIPAGPFQMGCDRSNPSYYCFNDQQPLHTVTLSGYFIDKYEVTNARYKACVDTGVCMPPRDINSYTRFPYYGVVAYADYPVIHVDWYQAQAFCTSVGKRLPTEAEWEKAARGSSDTRNYPWGNELPDCRKLNYWGQDNGCVGDTSEVGSYPSGSSPYGVMDMGGNVWEWVNDWYNESYYSVSPVINPQGPATGSYRVLRGGAWSFDVAGVNSVYRGYGAPDRWNYNGGFRCVRSQ